ncbi:hypothetical protein DV736_g3610, partial [Chaetothyriales sp. CBS 134916]
MIRLPPTGISLSDSDIDFHLQQIDIYHGLLKQGFKKKEILRYFDEHQATQNPSPRPCSSLGSPSLTTVELAARRHSSRDRSPDGQGVDDVPSWTLPNHHSITQAHRHAPRQSSLLRFAQVVSSSSPPDRTEPASDTHSENQPEASESQLVSIISRLHLSLRTDVGSCANSPRSIPRRWAEAEPFVPASQRESSSRSSLVNDARDLSLPHRADTPQLDQMSSSMPSSPPTMSTVNQDEPALLPIPSSPTLPPMPADPVNIDQQHRGVRTEARVRGRLHLELASFPVYNDGLPVVDQPQTPADLSRRLVVTEEGAAYTAPPGALYTASPTRRSRLTVTQGEIDYGDQSPVALAMDSRERRTRELMRGVRAERMRLQRQLQRDRDVIARGLDGGVEASDRDDPGPTTIPDFWRDDFEGDRVGDENWEGQGTVGWLREE